MLQMHIEFYSSSLTEECAHMTCLRNRSRSSTLAPYSTVNDAFFIISHVESGACTWPARSYFVDDGYEAKCLEYGLATWCTSLCSTGPPSLAFGPSINC